MCRNAILPTAGDAESLDSEVIWNGKIMDKAVDYVMGGVGIVFTWFAPQSPSFGGRDGDFCG